MIDREKVIKHIIAEIGIAKVCKKDFALVDIDMLSDALSMLKEQEAVEPFHKCIGKDFSLIEDSHFDYCPYCGKPITWAKQEGR